MAAQPTLFDEPPSTGLTLNPSQSLALRGLIDLLKSDDRIYSSCPDSVRSAICDILMPPYTTAEDQIRALIAANEAGLKLLEQFGAKIRQLSNQKDASK